jgi:hypothetical protein
VIGQGAEAGQGAGSAPGARGRHCVRRRPRRALLAATVGAAALVAALAPPSAGSTARAAPLGRPGQEDDAEATVGTFSLLAQGPAAVAVGDLVELDLEIPDPERDLVVAVEVYEALEGRDAVLDAAGRSAPPPLSGDGDVVAVGELAASTTSGGRQLLLDVRGPETGSDDTDAAGSGDDVDPATVPVDVPGPGVYPVALFLRERSRADDDRADRTVGVIDTALVVVDAAPDTTPLSFAWVWPVGAAPGLAPDGSVVPEVAAELGAGGRVQALTCAAQAVSVRMHPLPITLVPTPETVTVWAAVQESVAPPAPTTTTTLPPTTTTTVPPTTTTVPPTEPPPPDTGFGGFPAATGDPVDTTPVETVPAETVPETTTTVAPTTTTTTPAPAVDLATCDGYAALLDAVGRGAEVVASPWVDVDLPLLEAGGIGDELPDLRATGADALAAALAEPLAASGATRPVGQLQVGGRLDEPSLARLRAVGVDRLVVDPATLADRDTSDGGPAAVPLTRRFIVDSGDRQFESAAVDAALTRLLTDATTTPIETAQWALALLVATGAEEEPAADAGSDDEAEEDGSDDDEADADAEDADAAPSVGLVALAPDDWVPDARVLAQVTSGLEDTALAGHVEAVTLSDWFERVDFEVYGAPATLRELEPGTPTVTAGQLAVSRAGTAALRSLLGGDAPEVALSTVDARRALAHQLDGTTAAAYLAHPEAVVASLQGVVRAPNGRTLRFTDRAVEVPLQIQNTGDRPLQVEVVVSGENLTFPEGSSSFVELPAGENVVVSFAVESRCVCHSDLDITVQAPGNAASVLATGRLEVRVTTLGPVSVALTAGAAGFLALWWGMHWRRSRRRQRAAG